MPDHGQGFGTDGVQVAQFNAGEYNTTRYAKQGDLGKTLPPMPSDTVWERGQPAEEPVTAVIGRGAAPTVS